MMGDGVAGGPWEMRAQIEAGRLREALRRGDPGGAQHKTRLAHWLPAAMRRRDRCRDAVFPSRGVGVECAEEQCSQAVCRRRLKLGRDLRGAWRRQVELILGGFRERSRDEAEGRDWAESVVRREMCSAVHEAAVVVTEPPFEVVGEERRRMTRRGRRSEDGVVLEEGWARSGSWGSLVRS